MKNTNINGNIITYPTFCPTCGGLMPGAIWSGVMPRPCICGSKKIEKLVGWECPRCNSINSPYKDKCDCNKKN